MSQNPFTFTSDRISSSFEWVEFKETAQWCKDNIYLSSDTSPYTGMMSFEKTPWIEEILGDWDKPWIEEYDIMASTQVGKTTIEFCCITKEMDTDPTMMQLSIPNDNDVSNYIKKKLDPFLRGIKSLQTKLLDRKEEEKTRLKTATKEVDGGTLFVTGNTSTARASNTIRCFFGDEVSLYGSGDVSEFRERTKSFEKIGRKIMLVSSRRYEGDEIELAYDGSYCKKELQIKCKGCGKYFYPLGSKQFKYMTEKEYMEQNSLETIDNRTLYKKAAKDTGRVECECGYGTTSQDIEDLIRDRQVKLVIVEGNDEDNRHGYKLNALATGLTNYSSIVQELIDATDFEKKDRVYRGYFNELYEEDFEDKNASDMLVLGNEMDEYEVPEDVLSIYIGVDTQKDHFWYSVVAYGYKENSDLISAGRVETTNDLERIWERCQYLTNKHGEVHFASYMGIDRRGIKERTYEVDGFVKYMTKKYGEDRIYTTEGEPSITGNKPIAFRTIKDESQNRVKQDIKVMKVSNNYLKNSLHSRITNAIYNVKGIDDEDYIERTERLFKINQHIIQADAEKSNRFSVTEQLTSEVYDYKVDPKTKKRDKEKTWFVPNSKGEAGKGENHIWDCCVICEAFAKKDEILQQERPVKDLDIGASLDRLGTF